MSAETGGEHAPSAEDTRFFGHPRGLSTLFFTEMWERFSFYGMRAILVPFFTASIAASGLGLSKTAGAGLYGIYNSMVYLLALPGGWLADRVLGGRRSVLWGGVVIAAGHYVMAVPEHATAYPGLCLIAIGTGLLKPNISTMVGKLYATHDERRDAGFTIFYMAINLGALVAPLITGWFADRDEFHIGFGIAAVGMTLAVVQYVLGGRHLGNIGLRPPSPLGPGEGRRMLGYAGGVLGAVAVIVVGWMLITEFSVSAFSDALAAPIILTPFGYFAYMFRAPGMTRPEQSKLAAFVFFFIGATIFWMISDQSGSMLNLFAQDKVDMKVFGWTMPYVWLQSANPFFIILFAPPIAMLWQYLGERQPRTSIKFALSMLLIGGSFGLMGLLGRWTAHGALVAVWWLGLVYLIQAVAELCLSPVGLSVTTKLAPKMFAGQMLGLWFLATSVGNALNVYVTKLNPIMGNDAYYTLQGIAAGAVGVCFIVFTKKINNLMGDVH